MHLGWEKIFVSGATNRGLIPKIYKKLVEFNFLKKQPNQKMGKRPK